MDLPLALEQRAKVEEFTCKHRIGLLTLQALHYWVQTGSPFWSRSRRSNYFTPASLKNLALLAQSQV